MTTKERLHEIVDELTETEADDALQYIASRRNGDGDADDEDEDEESGEPETVWMPESWETFDDGTPQPDWTALIRADRDHGH